MYDFIFYVLYKANIKDGRFTARFQASLATFFAIFVHVALGLAVLKRIFRKQFESSGIRDWFNQNKAIYILLIALFVFLLYRYYNSRRIDQILNKHTDEMKP